jgi:hypothetical protein
MLLPMQDSIAVNHPISNKGSACVVGIGQLSHGENSEKPASLASLDNDQ